MVVRSWSSSGERLVLQALPPLHIGVQPFMSGAGGGVWGREEAATHVNVPEHMAGSAGKLRLGDHTVCYILYSS